MSLIDTALHILQTLEPKQPLYLTIYLPLLHQIEDNFEVVAQGLLTGKEICSL
jgi:hypothetical protein